MTQVSISASALVYLFGDLFSHPSLIRGISLPWRRARVDEEYLAVTMFVAEFMELMEGGQLSIKPRDRGALLTEALNVSCVEPAENIKGLARRIIDNVSTTPSVSRVQNNISRIVSCVLGKDCLDPWTIASEIVRQELVEQAYLEAGKRSLVPGSSAAMLLASGAQLSVLEGEAKRLRDRLDSFQERDPKFYATLWTQVCRGVYSRQECADL